MISYWCTSIKSSLLKFDVLGAIESSFESLCYRREKEMEMVPVLDLSVTTMGFSLFDLE